MQHRRPPLRPVARPRGTRRAADALRGIGVDVRIVEQPEPELVAQQPARRLVDPLLGDPPVADELDEQLGQLLAAELVAAGLDDLHELLRRC